MFDAGSSGSTAEITRRRRLRATSAWLRREKLVGKAGRRRLVGHSIFAAADYSGDRGNLKYTVLSGARCQAADHRSGKRRECRDVCDIHALIMDGREGTDARKSANQPWRTTILSRRQGESGAWPCAISLADWLAPAARDFCVSVGYRDIQY